MFDYFYGQSSEMFSYFRVPKILFRDIKFKDLSTDAKTLYGILLDRMGLSVKNGWLHSTMHPRPCSFITRTKPIMIYRTGGDENVEKSNHDCHRQSERRNRQNHDLRKSGRRACTGRQKGAAGGCRPAGVAYHSCFAPMASCAHCMRIHSCPLRRHCHQHGLAAAR